MGALSIYELEDSCSRDAVFVAAVWAVLRIRKFFSFVKFHFLVDDFVAFSAFFACFSAFHFSYRCFINPSVAFSEGFFFGEWAIVASTRFVIGIGRNGDREKLTKFGSFYSHIFENFLQKFRVFFFAVLFVENTIFCFFQSDAAENIDTGVAIIDVLAVSIVPTETGELYIVTGSCCAGFVLQFAAHERT